MCEERTRTFEPARALAAETIKLKRTLSDPLNQAGLANHLDSVPGPDTLVAHIPGAKTHSRYPPSGENATDIKDY